MKKLFALILLTLASAVFAAQPLTFVTLTGAGSLSDTALRQAAPAIERETGRPVVVLNLPGGEGAVGLRHYAAQAADGNTVLVGNTALGYLALMGRDVGLNPLQDLAPVHGLAQTAMAVFVPAGSPAHDMRELRAYSRMRNGLFAGSASPMSSMAVTLIDRSVGTRSTTVPYKQFGQAVIDLAAGRLDYLTGPAGTASTQAMVEAGKIRPIAVLGGQRSRVFPELPTLAEQGYARVPDFTWNGFYLHAATPRQIRARLEKQLARAVRSGQAELAPSAPARLNAGARALRHLQLEELEAMKTALGG